MSRIVFDAFSHSYRLNGRQVVHITQVLSWKRKELAFMNDFHRDRGSAVHAAIKLWIDGELDESTIDPRIMPYFEAWKSFERQTGFKAFPDLCERPMFHDDPEYAGTPDFPGTMGSRLALAEVKCGSMAGADLQTAACVEFPEMKRLGEFERFGVRLMPNGLFMIEQFKDARDWPAFCQKLKNYKEENYV